MVLATLDKIEASSIQRLPDAQKNQRGLEFFGQTRRGPLLPAWATRDRERKLREFYRADHNWMVQGAFAGVMNIIASTPWEVKGPEELSGSQAKFWSTAFKAARFGSDTSTKRPDIEYWQEFIRQADFGRGWSSFCKKGVDYLRHDCGWFWEVIAPGPLEKDPTGPAMALAHLDSQRCIPTGDPAYPVIYYDRYNKYHLLPTSRVMQLVDMPDGDEYHPGYGLCALSRAIAISTREILMSRYIEASLDDKPPPGIVMARGMVKEERERALKLYMDDKSRDEILPWGNQLWFFAADPALTGAGLETTSFMHAPEKFDFKTYTEIDVDALALALGVDRQDLWQLTGGNLGSGTQSEMLAQKSRGKLIGSLRTEIERRLNDILPEEYEFAFKFQDAQEDLERARIAESWSKVTASLRGTLSSDEIRYLLANQVEAVKDAITDENGEIRRVNDVGIQPPETIVNDTTPQNQTPAPAAAQSTAPAAGQPPVAAPAMAQRSRSDLGGQSDTDLSQKAIQSTLLDFENAFADLVNARVKGDIGGLRFGVIARDLLRRYGLQALRDGLEDGGVPQGDEPLDTDDLAAYLMWLAEQSAYVTDFGRTLTKGAQIDGDARAAMWGNKSIIPMYQQGVASANANGNYEWVLGDTEEHCQSCLRMNGQIHRMKTYFQKGILPKADVLECGGYNCDCSLVRTTERAKGRWL